MTWLIPLGVAFTSNLDNLTAGAALGAQHRRIGMIPNVIVALITALATWCAMRLGALTHVIAGSVLNVIGALALIGIGVVSVVVASKRDQASNRSERRGASRSALIRAWTTRCIGMPDEAVSLGQAGVLGIALSLNNLATGVAAGAAGASAWLTTLAAAFISIAFVALGSKGGFRLARRFSQRASSIVGGLLLVTLGIAALFSR